MSGMNIPRIIIISVSIEKQWGVLIGSGTSLKAELNTRTLPDLNFFVNMYAEEEVSDLYKNFNHLHLQGN